MRKLQISLISYKKFDKSTRVGFHHLLVIHYNSKIIQGILSFFFRLLRKVNLVFSAKSWAIGFIWTFPPSFFVTWSGLLSKREISKSAVNQGLQLQKILSGFFGPKFSLCSHECNFSLKCFICYKKCQEGGSLYYFFKW